MKKILILILSSLFVLSSCSGSNDENTTFEENEQGLAFYLLDDGTYGVGFGNACYLSTITIPSTYRNRKVTKVVTQGFAYNNLSENTHTIFIPDTITSIENGGFYNPNISNINYGGTFDQFNSIEFGKTWLSWESYNKLQFGFTDKTIKFADLFDSISVNVKLTNSNGDILSGYSEIFPDNNNSVTLYNEYPANYYSIVSSSSTNYFGGFNIENTLEAFSASGTLFSYESTNSDVISVSRSTNSDVGFYTYKVENVGQTTLNIKLFDMTYPLAIQVSDEALKEFNITYLDQSIRYDGNEHPLIYEGDLPSETTTIYSTSFNGIASHVDEPPTFKEKGLYNPCVKMIKNGYKISTRDCYVLISTTTRDDYMTLLKETSTDKHLYIHSYYQNNAQFMLFNYSTDSNYVNFNIQSELQLFGGYCYDIDLSQSYININGNDCSLNIDDIGVSWNYYSTHFIKSNYAIDLGDGKVAYHVFAYNFSEFTKIPEIYSYKVQLDD